MSRGTYEVRSANWLTPSLYVCVGSALCLAMVTRCAPKMAARMASSSSVAYALLKVALNWANVISGSWKLSVCGAAAATATNTASARTLNCMAYVWFGLWGFVTACLFSRSPRSSDNRAEIFPMICA